MNYCVPFITTGSLYMQGDSKLEVQTLKGVREYLKNSELHRTSRAQTKS